MPAKPENLVARNRGADHRKVISEVLNPVLQYGAADRTMREKTLVFGSVKRRYFHNPSRNRDPEKQCGAMLSDNLRRIVAFAHRRSWQRQERMIARMLLSVSAATRSRYFSLGQPTQKGNTGTRLTELSVAASAAPSKSGVSLSANYGGEGVRLVLQAGAALLPY